jgi:hypothetical protein
MFVYEDDLSDGLALSRDGLRILERAPKAAVEVAPLTRPVAVV